MSRWSCATKIIKVLGGIVRDEKSTARERTSAGAGGGVGDPGGAGRDPGGA